MAKQISQETFDSVVRENMEEFEMVADEAVNDAVQQFEAQGVDLSLIIKDIHLYEEDTGEGDSTELSLQSAINILSSNNDVSTDYDKLRTKSCLEKVKAECDIDLAHRCYVGKKGAYTALMKNLKLCKNDIHLFHYVVNTLVSLTNGQPDLLDNDGLKVMCDYLSEFKVEPGISASLVKLIRNTCVKHETNRQKYVGAGIIDLFVTVLLEQKKNAASVKEICFALRVLTFDDDVRVPFGKAHEHARLIVTEADALKTILAISTDYLNDLSVLGELFSTLGCLAVRNEFCQEIMDLGGIQLFIQTLQRNISHQSLSRQVLGVLKAVAGNDEVKIAVSQAGGIELVVAVMNTHIKQAKVCELACAALGAIILRNPVHCAKLMACEGPLVILRAMQLHMDQPDTLKQACMAIRNVVARTREYCPPLVEHGAEAILNEARMRHQSLDDEAKAALRDLDCKVELKELWTGEGKGIHR